LTDQILKARTTQGFAQRFALPALGRAAGRRPSGKMIRRRKLLEMAQNPQRRVHALLAGWSARPAG